MMITDGLETGLLIDEEAIADKGIMDSMRACVIFAARHEACLIIDGESDRRQVQRMVKP